MPAPDDDATIRLVRPPSVPRKRWLVRVLAVLGVLALCSTGWMALRLFPNPKSAVPSPVQAAAPPFDITTADEAAILAAPRPVAAGVPLRRRAARAGAVLPSLRQQGRMLDRLGAFVEKAGLPRDRVLTDAELDAAIRQSGDTEETYYYGHDYRVADMARFFAAADRDGIVLHPEEVRLRALLQQEGMLRPGAVGALISIPPEVDSRRSIDAAARATILHHELSHGVYFTDPPMPPTPGTSG